MELLDETLHLTQDQADRIVAILESIRDAIPFMLVAVGLIIGGIIGLAVVMELRKW
jgi:hypothetical protein